MANIVHGNVEVPVEQFEFNGGLYYGYIYANYLRHSDRSTITHKAHLIRLVDLNVEDVDWEDDDNLHTIPLGSDLAKALLAEYDDFVEDECRDDCRFDMW